MPVVFNGASYSTDSGAAAAVCFLTGVVLVLCRDVVDGFSAFFVVLVVVVAFPSKTRISGKNGDGRCMCRATDRRHDQNQFMGMILGLFPKQVTSRIIPHTDGINSDRVLGRRKVGTSTHSSSPEHHNLGLRRCYVEMETIFRKVQTNRNETTVSVC